MNNLSFFIVIFALLSILPAGIVFVALLGKIMDITRRIDAIRLDEERFAKMKIAIEDVEGQAVKNAHSLEAIKESFVSLNNKIISRTRRDTNRKEREIEEEEEPIEQPVLQFPSMPGGDGKRETKTRTILRPKQF